MSRGRLARETAAAAATGSVALLAGWLIWRRASRGELDPYDQETLWLGSLAAALLLGLLAPTVAAAVTAGFALMIAPVGGGWELGTGDEAGPFGPLGVLFLIGYSWILGFAAWGGFSLRTRLLGDPL